MMLEVLVLGDCVVGRRRSVSQMDRRTENGIISALPN
jgi:hypothetical protein